MPLIADTKPVVYYSYCVTYFYAATVLRLECCSMDIAAGF